MTPQVVGNKFGGHLEAAVTTKVIPIERSPFGHRSMPELGADTNGALQVVGRPTFLQTSTTIQNDISKIDTRSEINRFQAIEKRSPLNGHASSHGIDSGVGRDRDGSHRP